MQSVTRDGPFVVTTSDAEQNMGKFDARAHDGWNAGSHAAHLAGVWSRDRFAGLVRLTVYKTCLRYRSFSP